MKLKNLYILYVQREATKQILVLEKLKKKKKTGKLIIYENFIDNNNHTKLNFERFKELY